jgi:hypothetical protein
MRPPSRQICRYLLFRAGKRQKRQKRLAHNLVTRGVFARGVFSTRVSICPLPIAPHDLSFPDNVQSVIIALNISRLYSKRVFADVYCVVFV